MQAGSIQPGQNVLVVDDLIATGGSAKAAGSLLRNKAVVLSNTSSSFPFPSFAVQNALMRPRTLSLSRMMDKHN